MTRFTRRGVVGGGQKRAKLCPRMPPRDLSLKIIKFQKQITMFSFPPKNERKYFCPLFGGNENKVICF